MNTINPIQRIQTLTELQSTAKTSGANETPFKDVFSDAIKNVIETDNNVVQGAEMLASGQTDDPSGLMVDINKAQLAVSMLVQMRNKALESYNEVMRISL